MSAVNNNKIKSRLYAFRNETAVYALAIAIGLGAVLKSHAQEIKQAIKQAAATSPATVPEIVVTAPKQKPKVTRTPRAAGANAAAANTEPAQAASGTGTGPNGTMVPLPTVATVDKTGTPVANLPQSVVVVPRATVVEQGGTSVADAVRNVSGVNIGGSSTYGFFDRFTIRGMDARFYSDNFPDGDQSNGFPHSLNGVERIEVLKGPGSALFGSGPPGGTVNVVHFVPSAVPGYGLSQQVRLVRQLDDQRLCHRPDHRPRTELPRRRPAAALRRFPQSGERQLRSPPGAAMEQGQPRHHVRARLPPYRAHARRLRHRLFQRPPARRGARTPPSIRRRSASAIRISSAAR